MLSLDMMLLSCFNSWSGLALTTVGESEGMFISGTGFSGDFGLARLILIFFKMIGIVVILRRFPEKTNYYMLVCSSVVLECKN